jgi:uncharacterized protein
MKPSRYNLFIDLEDGDSLAFNSATGALASLEKEHRPRIEHLLKHPDRPETDMDREFLEALIGAGFLVGDAIDEIGILQAQANTHRHSKKTLSLTIAPTLACNFECDYCFEGRSREIMSESTQQALLDFADHYLGQAASLLVSWYGGEPTLCLPIVERLQRGLMALAADNQVEVEPTSIISNGYLLDGAAARRLKAIGISEVQITLDGPPAVHDQRRKLRNGRGTFDTIINNLEQISDILDVGIRINVDRDNTDDACEVIEILRERGLLSKLKVYFAQVQSSGGVCASIRDRCFGQEEFSRLQVRLYEKLMERGIYHVDYPQISGGVTCGAVSNMNFVVSPTGHMFKCWEEVSLDPQNSIGDIFFSEPTQRQQANIEKFKSWNPFHLSECRACHILPICLGGCPIHGLESGSPERGVCSPWKFNLNEMLKLRYRCENARQAAV